MKRSVGQLAALLLVFCAGCVTTPHDRQAELDRDLLHARKHYGAVLREFWTGTDAEWIELQGHLVAYAVEFADTTDPGIVDAIIDDLRAQRSRYTDEYTSSFGRQTIYSSLLQGLPRAEVILNLEKWFDSEVYGDRMYASNLLQDLEMYKVNRGKPKFFHFEFRSPDEMFDGLPNKAIDSDEE